MGKQKGKPSFCNVSGAKGLLPQKEKESRAPRPKRALPQGERVTAPDGLPAGWYAERIKDFKGKMLLRFSSEDGKHKQLTTVTQAIRQDGKLKGYDVDAAVKAYEKKVEEREAQNQKARDDPERSALDAFRAKHGFLDHSTLAHLPGWALESRVIAKTGQKTWIFKGPGEARFGHIKQVETLLGRDVLAGKEIEGFEAARKAAEGAPAKTKAKLRKRHPGAAARATTKLKPGDKMDVDKPAGNKPKKTIDKKKQNRKK